MWLFWIPNKVFELGRRVVSLLGQPSPVLFCACIRESFQGVSSITSLSLFCLPAHQRGKLEDYYRNLGEGNSYIDLRPQHKTYVELDEKEGGLKSVKEMRDFFVM